MPRTSKVLKIKSRDLAEIVALEWAGQEERNLAKIKKHSLYKEEDTVVPRFQLPKLLLGVKEIGKKYNFRSICYGHAGDGNLHVNILKENNKKKGTEIKINQKSISIKLEVVINGS